jgi:hypothetical protein
MRLRCVLAFGGALVLLAALTHKVAGGSGAKPSSPPPQPAAVELPPFTPEREAAALQFVAQHHPELGEVLARVKTLNRDQYQQAIRELFLEAEKLAAVKEKDEGLYQLLLEAWKVKSRIEVLAAQIACTREKDARLEAELKKLLYRQVDLHREQVEYNRERTLATLKVMEANIKLLQEKRDEMVDRRFRILTGGKKAGAGPQGASPQPNQAP